MKMIFNFFNNKFNKFYDFVIIKYLVVNKLLAYNMLGYIKLNLIMRVILLLIIFYKGFVFLSTSDTTNYLFPLIISFCFSYLVLNILNFSDKFLIRFLQQFIILNILILLITYAFYYFLLFTGMNTIIIYEGGSDCSVEYARDQYYVYSVILETYNFIKNIFLSYVSST